MLSNRRSSTMTGSGFSWLQKRSNVHLKIKKKSKILCKKEATSNFFKKNFAKKKQVLKMSFVSFLQSFFWRKWTLLLSCKVFTWKYFSCCIYACWPSHLQTSALVFWPKGPGLYLDKHSHAWTSLPTAAPHVASIRLVGWLISHTGQAFAPGNWFKISPVCQHHWSVGLPTPGLLMLQPSHTCARHALLLQLVSWLFHVWPSLSKPYYCYDQCWQLWMFWWKNECDWAFHTRYR